MAASSAEAPPWQQWLDGSIAALRERSLFRTLRPTLPGISSVEVQLSAADLEAWCHDRPPQHQRPLPSLTNRADLRTVKLFSLNDYLGLSSHPAVCSAVADAARACGNGPRSSSLVGGYTCHHRELEYALAELKGTEEALLFPTGFAANLAVIAALAAGGGGDVVVFSDELNHASIVDGARLGRRGGATLSVYRHNDLAHLEALLASAPPAARTVVVTDSLFSMDGDFADLRGLAALRRRHGFLLAVDEAHATLVCGDRGGGAVEAAGIGADVDLHLGTLSKAFGGMGGFLACSAQWKHLFVNRARAQVYSTALPVPTVAGCQAALRVATDEPWRRERVWELSRQLGESLSMPALSPIVPVVLGSEAAALRAAARLLRAGFHVPAIRPPTVPEGTSRLRVSLSAAHTAQDVRVLAEAVRGCLRQEQEQAAPDACATSRL